MMIEMISNSLIDYFEPVPAMLLSAIASLFFGFIVAILYKNQNKYTQSLAITLVLLPAMVMSIIMLVDGNIGVGVAVAGAFSLIRFRSIPGTARDISYLFLAMSIGFITGLGFVFLAFMFLVVMTFAILVLKFLKFGELDSQVRVLKIRIPENLDNDKLFDDIFLKYVASYELETIRTVQMGALFELTYMLKLKKNISTKAFIDELRIRNGNMSIILSRIINENEML